MFARWDFRILGGPKMTEVGDDEDGVREVLDCLAFRSSASGV